MPPLILKRAPIGSNVEDFNVLENGVLVGRIQGPGRAARPPLDVGKRALGGHGQARRTRLRADARGGNGCVR